MYTTAFLIVLAHLFYSWEAVRKVFWVAEFIFPLQGESILTALFLAVIAHALARRKRVGWWLALLYTSLELVSAIAVIVATESNFQGFAEIIDTDEYAKIFTTTAILLVFVIALLISRRHFTARLAEKSITAMLYTVIAGIAATTIVVLAVAFALATAHHEHFNAAQALRRYFIGGDPLPGADHSQIPDVIVSVGIGATVILALVVLMRARAVTTFTDLDEELRLRELLINGADSGEADSLGYFATRRDKGSVFGADGKAVITYRSLMGVCLASGDPVGPRDHWPSAIDAYLKHTADKGLAPAVVGVSKKGAEAFAAAGLKARIIGDEAILNTDTFDLNDPQLKAVRHAVKRVRDAGYTVRVRRHRDLSDTEMHRLISLADQWRQNGDDRGFSMALNRLGDPLDGACVFVEALDSDGNSRGLLSFVPWGRTGLSLDVMRRDVDHAENGVTEFMVASLMDNARELGISRVSLNFAALREIIAAGEDVGATFLQRMGRSLVSAVSKKFQIEQLYRSNLKYNPIWAPRYLCWRDTGDLASIGIAIGLAEGQLSLPFLHEPDITQPIYPADDPRIVAFLEQAKAHIPERRVPEQVRHRMAVRENILAHGEDAYPAHFDREYSLEDLAQLPAGSPVTTAGRIIGRSDHGGVIFLRIQDFHGATQIICERDTLGQETMTRLRRELSIGDHIGARGTTGTSRTGTPSIIATSVTLTAKSLRPLPNMHQGLSNEETKVRQRYLDLIVNEDARRQVEARSAIIHSLRSTLMGEKFLEVETPLLQTIHGGANARPFKTHINAYDMGLYLRIAPELYLKRLMVGGVDRVFEIGRNFRNEGADATHNPEFTMLEAYAAYGDYNSMRELTRELIINAALAANGHTRVTGRGPDGAEHSIDLADPWRVVTVHGGIAEATGRNITPDTSKEELIELAAEYAVPVDPEASRGAIVIELHEHLAERFAIAPTFFCDFPTDVSPLTRQHRTDPRVAEKWDLICFGAEVATAYSELIDPVIQRQRLVNQSLLAAGGDPEAMEVDEDFLLALEYAMPPSGGMGMGVDRLVMMLTEKNIRETIIFPLVKPQQ
ncbi:hypothetical protein CAQU_02745 [Corynebacterium aquilae DSM 44791]|uniref:Lysine--tRNA ligase n=1 Tax=Corynebacterium aquilae DSM 44791 TaxID=1431546 RepID=A0A1L7CEA9_9CORY|nr:hypothetical protein CAQU_02745 [Corynebacterium aquilae DSM 44791]